MFNYETLCMIIYAINIIYYGIVIYFISYGYLDEDLDHPRYSTNYFLDSLKNKLKLKKQIKND